MRRKVYTREHILKAAYELINKEGFGNFTARNIAKANGDFNTTDLFGI